MAIKWVEDKVGEKGEKNKDIPSLLTQMKNCITNESWEPVSEDQLFGVSALDVVSMLLQMAKQYFDFELPVSEEVVKRLGGGFGFVLQQYGRIVLQDCGAEKKAPWLVTGAQKRSISIRAVPMNFGGKDKLGRLRNKTAGALGMEAEDSMDADSLEPESEASHGSPEDANTRTVESVCIRLSTIDYIADRCEDLCKVVLDGCRRNNYTGKPLDDILDVPMNTLKEHAKAIAEKIAGQIVFFEVEGFYDKLYHPAAARSPLSTEPILAGVGL